jgi:hypothetical protein
MTERKVLPNREGSVFRSERGLRPRSGGGASGGSSATPPNP